MKNRGPSDPYSGYTSKTTSANYSQETIDECVSLKFTEKLRNLTPAFKNASISEILTVKLISPNTLMTYSENGEAYGNIISSFNGTIIQCIRREKEFGVEVLSLQGSILVFSA
jgi:hypothetical protein